MVQLRVEYGTLWLNFKFLCENRHMTSEYFAVNDLGKVVRTIDFLDRGLLQQLLMPDASQQYAYGITLSMHVSICGLSK